MSGPPVILPLLLLALVAIAVPRTLGRRLLPETHRAVWINAGLSALVLWAFAALLFLGLYLQTDIRIFQIIGYTPGGSLWHFARLGLLAGLIWAPIGALALSTVPGRWQEGVW